jgi:hypothetical protein
MAALAIIGVGYLLGAYLVAYVAGRANYDDAGLLIVLWPFSLTIMLAIIVLAAPIYAGKWFFELGERHARRT